MTSGDFASALSTGSLYVSILSICEGERFLQYVVEPNSFKGCRQEQLLSFKMCAVSNKNLHENLSMKFGITV